MERNLQGNRDKEGNLMTDEQYAKSVPADDMLDDIIKERGGEAKEPVEKVELTKDEKVEALVDALYKAKAGEVRGILDEHNMTAEEAFDMFVISDEMEGANPEAYAELAEMVKHEKAMGTAEESEPKTAPRGMLGLKFKP
ncbi:MAG: GLTP domain-containing protein [Gammaproteobacteria bacterium]|nr:GLTP domain-containing protein [Gammaproteobacteria bacterium]